MTKPSTFYIKSIAFTDKFSFSITTLLQTTLCYHLNYKHSISFLKSELPLLLKYICILGLGFSDSIQNCYFFAYCIFKGSKSSESQINSAFHE